MAAGTAHAWAALRLAGRLDKHLWRRIAGLAEAATVLLVPFAVLSYLGALGWVSEIFGHFRVQFLAVALICTAVLAATRRWRYTAVAAAVALAQIVPLAPYLEGEMFPSHQQVTGAPLRIAYHNMLGEYSDHAAFIAYVRVAGPDVLVLTEVDPVRRESLVAGLHGILPHRLRTSGDSKFDVVVLSRHELKPVSQAPSAGYTWPMVHVQVCPEAWTGCLQLVGVHTRPPGGSGTFLRNRAFGEVARRVGSSTGPVIAVGDFNSTPWSPDFRRMLRAARLKDDSAARAGLSATWVSRLPLLGLDIDHVLVSAGVRESARRVGPNFGSDHFSLIVDLAVSDLAAKGGGS